ncbi:MAG: hypothetical protein WAX69_00205, partial [Victivallales bacterium]
MLANISDGLSWCERGVPAPQGVGTTNKERPEERQPFGTGIHAFVFFVASPFAYARYAQGLRLKSKCLYLP